MITIDFPFFSSMHDKLKQPFNAADYTLEQLNILYNSQNMLSNREFCSEEFANGANEYFAEHRNELTKIVALNKASGDPPPTIIELLQIMEKHTNNWSRILFSVFFIKLLTRSPEVLEYALANIQDTDLPKLSDIWIGNKEEIENLARNLTILNSEQAKKTIANPFLKTLLPLSPELLEYALDNIKDADLSKLNNIGIWPYNKEPLENLINNISTLTVAQEEKVISNQFLKNLLIRNPDVLEYALDNIEDTDLPKLSAIWIWNKEQIENLVSNLIKLESEQKEKVISNQLLKNLLIKDPELLEYALANIEDTDLLKLSCVTIYNKEDIKNLANNLIQLNLEQIEKAVSQGFITRNYELIKEWLGITEEVENIIDGSEYKVDENGGIITDHNVTQNMAESKMVGECDYLA